MRYIIILLTSFIGIFSLNAQTFYYKLIKQKVNGVITEKVSGGQFLTFVNNSCYESDCQGFSVGNGVLKYSRQEKGLDIYSGDCYYGNAIMQITSDRSMVNIHYNNNIYVYKKSEIPSGVTTCSLIKKTIESPPNNYYDPYMTNYNIPSNSNQNGITHNHNSTNVYENKNNSSKRRCVYCNGSGQITRNDNAPANFGIDKPRKQCLSCGEWYNPNVFNHYHIRCGQCGGTGFAK